MLTARLTDSTHEQGVSAIHGATLHPTRSCKTAYTTVNWDYPPSPAAYRDALLSRGASHSRFLRIAYLSTRERKGTPGPSSHFLSPSPRPTVCSRNTSTAPSASLTSSDISPQEPAVRLPPVPPIPHYPPLRPCVTVRPRSANPPHTLKRRQSPWPKPPHYHASLLRSPLSRRKGLFRAVLPPNQAVDFFRWDLHLGVCTSLSTPCPEHGPTRTSGVDVRASLHTVESVLEPYEAAAGFFGWHGLGLDVIRQGVDDERCSREGVNMCRPCVEHGHDGARTSRLLDLQFEIDESEVEEGRARWACTAEELVGPPGIALRLVIEQDRSGTATVPSDPAHKDIALSTSNHSRRLELRWDPDIGSSPSRLSGPNFVSRKKISPPSNSNKLALETDSPSMWWYGPPHPHHEPLPGTTPHIPPLCFPPPPVRYAPPPWFPDGRVASAQCHGYWYSAQPIGAPSSMNRDLHPSKSLAPQSQTIAIPVTPTSVHPPRSPRYLAKPSLSPDEYGSRHDCDKDADDYESTTTTTDSDPPPHTPVGAATTSHCVDALRVHGDDEVEVHGVEMDGGHASASVTIGLLNPATPIKHPGRFSTSMSPSVSPGSLGSNQDGCYESPKAAVVFPSLNGSFCQGSSSRMPVSLLGREMSVQTTANRVAPASPGDEDSSKMKSRSGGLEASPCSVSGNNPAFIPSLSSPRPTSPNSGLRKDSQGFWEPVMPISPSSSSSSLPFSSPEGKTVSRFREGWIDETTDPVPRESSDSPETASSHVASSMARSLSPSPHRVDGVGFARLSSSRPVSLTSPTPTPTNGSVFGGSYPSSPSPSNNVSLVPLNPTTLLPTFLATATVKRKKASRTREIVDRLRSSSIDAGKSGAGLESLGWASAAGELDSTLRTSSSGSDRATGNPRTGGRSSPSPSPPSKSSLSEPASTLWSGSDAGKNRGQASGLKSSDADAARPGGKSRGTTQAGVSGPETRFSLASPRTVTTTTPVSPNITPFPILSVSQNLTPNATMTHESQTGRPALSSGGDGSKMNAAVAVSPNKRHSSLPFLPSSPNGATSPSAHLSHHPLPSPSRPAHPLPPLGPPPLPVAVSPYPHTMYVPFTQYHVAPPHQVQQGPGTWLAVYPARPPHLPVHPLPAQMHVSPITGVSGMRHVSW